MVVLAFILTLVVLALGDISARAGRADAWVVLCGQCENSEVSAFSTHTTTGALRDGPYLSR
jgi:hypothetical protein